jgi:hypothetical protein
MTSSLGHERLGQKNLARKTWPEKLGQKTWPKDLARKTQKTWPKNLAKKLGQKKLGPECFRNCRPQQKKSPGGADGSPGFAPFRFKLDPASTQRLIRGLCGIGRGILGQKQEAAADNPSPD